ncbi:MAG TPA: VOC family protein, partial [Actinomycetota bacterium]|nr:VOC family protein [Actinomycetota bacterium]
DYDARVDPDGVGPRLYFQRVPEAKTAKNRVHLDLEVSGRGIPLEEVRRQVAAAVERAVAAGATKVREVDEADEHWVVLQDPEGNEFCLH